MTKGKKNPKKRQLTRSVGAVVISPDNLFLLVFQAKGQFWEFPKGKVEDGEKDMQTLAREIEEETGIKTFDILPGYKETIFYHFFLKDGKRIDREVAYYLIRTTEDINVHVSEEHEEFQWVEAKKAISLLPHQNHKDLVRKALKQLEVA